MLLSSTVSGHLVSRTGRYKVFPVLGTAITAIGGRRSCTSYGSPAGSRR
ncbi:hypothetical protein SANTM175S_01341 [Streptomyces antimycoticus]